MWGWQNTNQPSDPVPGSSGTGNHTAVPVSSNMQGQPQGQELTEMLTMLDQGGPATFEDLNINMFSTPFE